VHENSAVPPGLWVVLLAVPAPKRWAIGGRPYGAGGMIGSYGRLLRGAGHPRPGFKVSRFRSFKGRTGVADPHILGE